MPEIRLEGKDDLSGVLRPISVQGRIYCRSELTAPWSFVSEKGRCPFSFIRRQEMFPEACKCRKSIGGEPGRFADFPERFGPCAW